MNVKINWKDFGLMYVIAFVLYSILLFIGQNVRFGLASYLFSPLLAGLILFGIPFCYYFVRNKCELKEAALLSFLFSLLFYPVFMVLSTALKTLFPPPPSGLPGMGLLYTDWSGVLLGLALITIFGTIIGIAVYLIKENAFPDKKAAGKK